MKARRAIRLSLLAMLCPLLGAVTTVGVAWGCRLWSPPQITSVAIGPRTQPWPGPCAGEGWAWRPDRVSSATGLGIYDVDASQLPSLDHTTRRMRVEYSGWPWRSLRSLRYSTDRPETQAPGWGLVSYREGVARWEIRGRRGLIDMALMRPARRTTPVAWLPLAPVWPDFALDMAVYAIAWSLLMGLPVVAYRLGRSRFRVSKGMCASCGYDLSGSPGGACPECGHTGAGAL